MYCTGNFLKPFRFFGKIFLIIKIIIPIVIIAFGMIDLGKAILSSKDDEVKKSLKSLAMRALAGIIIFFLPTIINFVFALIDGWNEYETDYSNCSKCISSPYNC